MCVARCNFLFWLCIASFATVLWCHGNGTSAAHGSSTTACRASTVSRPGVPDAVDDLRVFNLARLHLLHGTSAGSSHTSGKGLHLTESLHDAYTLCGRAGAPGAPNIEHAIHVANATGCCATFLDLLQHLRLAKTSMERRGLHVPGPDLLATLACLVAFSPAGPIRKLAIERLGCIAAFGLHQRGIALHAFTFRALNHLPVPRLLAMLEPTGAPLRPQAQQAIS
mmetsp:Transcript_104306/g.185440  ORF Transcript_104306/g.185440 Transcript_104306/m.185440 type:complete len:224 (+) Transcript_104306:3446-4117(+)